MNWLTLDQIQEASQSLATAFPCSLEHWRQLKGATPEELRKGYDVDKVGVGTSFCAICRWCNCRRCSLSTNKGCCDGLWRKAVDALIGWKANPTSENFYKWTIAATNVYDYINQKYEEYKMSKTHKIEGLGGKEVSDETITIALKAQFRYDDKPQEPEKHIFGAGQVARCGDNIKDLRIIIKYGSELTSFDRYGYQIVAGQDAFETYHYGYVCTLEELFKKAGL